MELSEKLSNDLDFVKDGIVSHLRFSKTFKNLNGKVVVPKDILKYISSKTTKLISSVTDDDIKSFIKDEIKQTIVTFNVVNFAEKNRKDVLMQSDLFKSLS